MADQKKRGRSAAESLTLLVLIVGILVVINFIFYNFNWGRIDATESRLWSLSSASKRLVAELDDQMEITAYFTEDLPPPFNMHERYVRDILSEYAAASNGGVRFRIMHPETDEEKEEANEEGMTYAEHTKVEDDAASVKEGYRGVVIKYLGERELIPLLPRDLTGLEYMVTMKIKQLAGDKTEVGVISGHDGPTLAEGLSNLTQSMPTYEFKEVAATSEIDQDLAAILLIGPQTALSDQELRYIDQFVMRGGSLGVYGAGVKVNLEGQNWTGEVVDTGINTLLAKYGVEAEQALVADSRSFYMQMRTRIGIPIGVPYPPAIVVPFEEDAREHPASFRLPGAVLPFPTPLSLTSAPEGVSVSILGNSSENSWKMSGASIDLRPRDPREWRPGADAGPFPVIAAIEGKLGSAFTGVSSEEGSQIESPPQAEADVRVFVAGSLLVQNEFIAAPANQQSAQSMNGSMALAFNSIDWLAAESDLIAIRAKTIEDPPIDVPTGVSDAITAIESAIQEQDEEGVKEALEERKAAMEGWRSTKNVYRWVNTLGIPLLFVLFGVIRWRMRQAKRANIKL